MERLPNSPGIVPVSRLSLRFRDFRLVQGSFPGWRGCPAPRGSRALATDFAIPGWRGVCMGFSGSGMAGDPRLGLGSPSPPAQESLLRFRDSGGSACPTLRQGSMPSQRDSASSFAQKPAEVQRFQVGEVAQLCRDRPSQLVKTEVQRFQVGEVANSPGIPVNSLLLRFRDSRLERLPNSPGIVPVSRLSLRFRDSRLGRLPNFPGDPGQLVAAEVQGFQVGEVAQLCRDRPSQLVKTEVQRFQVGEAAQLPRDRPSQLVEAEAQPDNAATVVNINTVPLADRLVGQSLLFPQLSPSVAL